MFSFYLSVGTWKGFYIQTCDLSVHINIGYLSICLSTTDFESLFSDILRHDGAYKRVKREHLMRVEDRLLRTFEELEDSEKLVVDLQDRIDTLESELKDGSN